MRKRPRMQRDFVMGCRPGDGTDGEHAIALANREKSGVKSSRWDLEDQRNARELESARFRVFVALEGGDEDGAREGLMALRVAVVAYVVDRDQRAAAIQAIERIAAVVGAAP